MGFRNELDAARARIAALEQDLEALRRENSALARRLEAKEAKEESRATAELPRQKPPREPSPHPAPFGPTIDTLIARAYGSVIALWATLLAATALCWAGSFGLMPTGLRPALPVVIVSLTLLAALWAVVALWLGARPIQRSSGYDGPMMGFVLWVWLPLALFVPLAGQVVALVRVVSLFRGRLGGATLRSNVRGRGTSRTFPDVSLQQGESKPAAWAYLAFALAWPALVVSMSGTSLGRSRSSFDTVRRGGRVTAVTGAAPAKLEQACTLVVESRFLWSQNCRVQIRCGEGLLYGGAGMGYVECKVRDGVPVSAVDPRDTAQEGDPKMDLDLPGAKVVVADDAPQPYSVTISLDPAP
jgi:hypothetical protein